MSGPVAREPYAGWYARILARKDKARTDADMTPDLMSLALIYHGITDAGDKETYKSWYLSTLDAYMDERVAVVRSNADGRSGPFFGALLSMDLMWTYIPDPTKLKALEAGSGNHAFHYTSGSNQVERDFDYHSPIGHAPAFAFAALFDGEEILDHPDATANPDTYAFDTSVYTESIAEELSDTGHFRQVENRITTADMDLTAFTLSTPHYFDARGTDGTLYAFAPQTDGVSDGYTKQKDPGQWTVDVETTTEEHLTLFLNVLSVGDNGTQPPAVSGFKGDNASGAVIGNRLVVFAHEPGTMNDVVFRPQVSGDYEALIFNLLPATNYHLASENGQVTVSAPGSQGSAVTTSAMGAVRATIAADGSVTPQDQTDPTPDSSDPTSTPPDGGGGGGGGCFLSGVN